MIPTFDLPALASEIDDPYRPRTVARLSGLEVALLVAEGRASWFRQVTHDELLLVLEGVITLDGPGGRLVISEGELAVAERNARHHVQSGMRSTILLVQELRNPDEANGHRPPDGVRPGALTRYALGTDVFSAAPFAWLPVGTVGPYGAHATRLVGASSPFAAQAESLLVVYRGVLDYQTADREGTLVGGQMLVCGPLPDLALRSQRGATILWLGRRGASLPRPLGADPDAAEGDVQLGGSL